MCRSRLRIWSRLVMERLGCRCGLGIFLSCIVLYKRFVSPELRAMIPNMHSSLTAVLMVRCLAVTDVDTLKDRITDSIASPCVEGIQPERYLRCSRCASRKDLPRVNCVSFWMNEAA